MTFFQELKRRNVFRVAIAYLAASWLLTEITGTLFPMFGYGDAPARIVVILLAIGFPLFLTFSWAYEMTPEGLKREKDVVRGESTTQLTAKRLDGITIGLIVIALLFIAVDRLWLGSEPADIPSGPAAIKSDIKLPSEQQTVESHVPSNSIAVLPFDDLSPGKDQEYFVLGLSEEILNSLAQITDLTVIAKTSSFAFRDTNKTIQEIAGALGVENILEGSVRKAGNALRITAQLINATDGSHLWSKTYDKEFNVEEIFSVQEDIAKVVASELEVTLGVGNALRKLGGTDNQEAYELFLTALGGLEAARTPDDIVKALEGALSAADAAIEIDPQFAFAWALKSHMLSGALDVAERDPDEALRAAMRAIELQPNLPYGYAALGQIRAFGGEFIEAALAFEKASELNGGSLEGYVGYGQLLHTVAFFKKADELLKKARLIDPLNGLVAVTYLENLGALGDIEQAEKENDRLEALLGHDWYGHFIMNYVRLGSGLPVTRDQIVTKGFSSPVNGVASEYLESPEQGLLAVRRFYNEAEDLTIPDLTSVASWAAYFGDAELAMECIERAISLDKTFVRAYWYPLFKEVRQLPRFKKQIQALGLVDFWNRFGWPDICHQTGDGDFVCD